MKAIALLVIWMALWGEVSVANLVSGVVLVGSLCSSPVPRGTDTGCGRSVHCDW